MFTLIFILQVAGVIVENTFTSIDDMVIELARKLYNLTWIHYFRLFFSFYLTSYEYLIFERILWIFCA